MSSVLFVNGRINGQKATTCYGVVASLTEKLNEIRYLDSSHARGKENGSIF